MPKKFKMFINGQLKQINFTVMGLDTITSDFLNWCMENRDNLEYIKECNTMKSSSNSVVLHFDHLSAIKRIDDVIKHQRA
jgi:hypothetical protein